MAKKVLGKGLSAIISASSTPVEALEKGIARNAELIVEMDVSSILPNPDQPRGCGAGQFAPGSGL